jgi:hypothetical protein
LLNGEVIGSTTSEDKWQLDRTTELQKKMIEKSRDKGAVLNVRTIPLVQIVENYIPDVEVKTPKPQAVEEKVVPITDVIQEKPLNIMGMLQHLMLIYEKFIVGNKKIREDFDTILKKKFMEKIDTYDYLDPFAAEFQYSNGKITYTGQTQIKEVASGLVKCLEEISIENDMQKWLKKHLGPWEEKYSREIEAIKK